MAPRVRRAVRLVASTQISPSVKSLDFEATDGQGIGHISGQWMNLFIPTKDGEVKRAYSIASVWDASKPPWFEIAVTRVEAGVASNALHEMKVGDEISMEGPYGVFTLDRRPDTVPVVFVGTGTGVTPLRAMLRTELAARTDGPPQVLLFGCRTPAEILYREEFEGLVKANPRFRYEYTLSRGEDDWMGHRGYVQTHLPRIIEATGAAHVYICGLAKMVEDVRRVLKEDLGFDRKQIHSERYD